jgi:hypothetical protein
MAKVAIGFLGFSAGLFATCSAVIGVTATLWAFGILYAGCTIGILVVWWWEDRQQREITTGEKEGPTLEARVEALTGRVSTVYPQPGQEQTAQVVRPVPRELLSDKKAAEDNPQTAGQASVSLTAKRKSQQWAVESA